MLFGQLEYNTVNRTPPKDITPYTGDEPPIKVLKAQTSNGEGFRLIDGYRRVLAALRTQRRTIPAHVLNNGGKRVICYIK